MGAEDFSYMLLAKPGCYAFIANGDGDHRDLGHGGGPVSYTHLDVYKRQAFDVAQAFHVDEA